MRPLTGSGSILAIAHFLSRRSRKSRSQLSLVRGAVRSAEKDVTERDGRDMHKLATALLRVDEGAHYATHSPRDSERAAARRRWTARRHE